MTRKQVQQVQGTEQTSAIDTAAQAENQGEQNLTAIVAASVFKLSVQDAEKRLTQGGTQYDRVSCSLSIDGGEPGFLIKIVAYAKTVYSVEVFRVDGGDKLYKSPKSSIADTAIWLCETAKIASGLATELKKLIIGERRAALKTLEKAEQNDNIDA